MIHSSALNQLFNEARTYNEWSDKPVDERMVRDLHDLVKWGRPSANSSPARSLRVARAQIDFAAQNTRVVCFAQSGTFTGEHTGCSPDAESVTRIRRNLSTAFHERAEQQWLARNCGRRLLEDKHRRLQDEDSSDRRDRQRWWRSRERVAEAQCRHSLACT